MPQAFSRDFGEWGKWRVGWGGVIVEGGVGRGEMGMREVWVDA